MKAVFDKLRAGLDERRAHHLFRSRKIVDGKQGASICIEGKQYLNFSSNDYLGLASHPGVIEALKTGADKYGVGSGAAHLISGHSYAHHALEEELAEFCGRQRAVLFSTGYMANLGVISALLDKSGTIFEDKLNHASMIDGGLLSGAKMQRYLHADINSLEKKLANCTGENKLIASDGVFSMDGDIAPVIQLAQVATQNKALLMIDDAHGLGVLGNNGAGTLEQMSLSSKNVPLLMGTLGKAFGTFGAFVAGDDELVETLIQKARTYIYTTAIPPAIAHATRKSLSLLVEEKWRRSQLQENISHFRNGAAQLGIKLLPSDTPIQPVLINDTGKLVAVRDKLLNQGILVGAIRPPTVAPGTERLRITLSTTHTTHNIDMLLDALGQVL